MDNHLILIFTIRNPLFRISAGVPILSQSAPSVLVTADAAAVPLLRRLLQAGPAGPGSLTLIISYLISIFYNIYLKI